MSVETLGKDGENNDERLKPLIDAKSHPRASLDMVSGLDRLGEPIPAWNVLANFAEKSARTRRGFSYSWAPIIAPPGVEPGRTIVGMGRKNLVLGTLKTAIPPEPSSTTSARRRPAATTFPCGIFIGLCRTLADKWNYIESSILNEWNISPHEGDWADQRQFYHYLRGEHIGRFEYRPGLVWAVPYWVLSVSKRIETEVGESAYLTVKKVKSTGALYFGDTGAGSVDFAIPRKALKNFRFQSLLGFEDKHLSVVAVNRIRYRKNRVPIMFDNYFLHGLLEDEFLIKRGFNRATEPYYQEIDGWKLHGAWAILTAAFIGNSESCYEVVYTHQVIDPFTQRSHDIGLIKSTYEDFWEMSYGLAESVLHLAR